MSEIELSYEKLKQEIMSDLVKHDLMVMATSDGEKVSARTVMTVFDKLTVYVGTKKNSRKYKQIEANQNVALASGRFQIEGIASLKGHPKDESNNAYLERFKEQQPERFKNQNSRGNFDNPSMRVIEIAPKRIAYYVQGPTAAESYIAILEPDEKRAYKLTREKDQF